MCRELVVPVLLAALAGGCHSARSTPTTSGFTEELVGVPNGTDGEKGSQLLLQTTLYRPQGAGRFPLVIINHGAPPIQDPAKRREPGRTRFFAQAKWFLDRGFAVAVPMRRGYAGSDGDYAEGFGSCDDPDYPKAFRETARDIAAAVRYFTAADFVDPTHIVALGVSAGGLGVLALAAGPNPGVNGVINFSGGRGGRDPAGTGRRCAPERLTQAMTGLGRTARLPTLWIYGENDSWFPQDVVQPMSDAWHKEGGRGELIVLPQFGPEGHSLFGNDVTIKLWAEPVTRYLRGLGYALPEP